MTNGIWSVSSLEFFTIPPQYKNVNIANFVFALSLEIHLPNVAFNLKIQSSHNPRFLILHLPIPVYVNKDNKLLICGNTNLAIMPTLPTLCVSEKLDLNIYKISSSSILKVKHYEQTQTEVTWHGQEQNEGQVHMNFQGEINDTDVSPGPNSKKFIKTLDCK